MEEEAESDKNTKEGAGNEGKAIDGCCQQWMMPDVEDKAKTMLGKHQGEGTGIGAETVRGGSGASVREEELEWERREFAWEDISVADNNMRGQRQSRG